MEQTPAINTGNAPAQRPVDAFRAVLYGESVQNQFFDALKEYKDTFITSLIDYFVDNKQLHTCDPKELAKQALKAAVMKIPINRTLGYAYIVVYNNSQKQPDGQWVKVSTPTFVLGYKGLIQLALRTGQYRIINADVVHEGELQKVDKLSGTIDFNGTPISNKVVGYFAHFELFNGFRKTLYMSVDEMAEYAKRYSPSVGRNTSVEQLAAKANEAETGKKVGWEGNFNDMATKTVLRRLLGKYGYLSFEMMQPVEREINAEAEAMHAPTLDTEAEEINLDDAEVQHLASQTDTDGSAASDAEPQY